MSTDTMKPQRTVLRDDRKTVTQLLAAAEKDTDAVSVFMAGCTVADTEAAVFVVKGPEAIAYLRELCKRQGLLTDKPVTGPACNEVKRRCAAESEAMALRGQLGAASGWIVKALKVLDTVDPDDTDEAERLAALVKAGEMLALTTLACSKTPNRY